MSIVWVLGVTLSVAVLIFGAPAMLFVRELRPLAKWVAIASLVAAVYCHTRYQEALNVEAIAAGFNNIEDRRTAQEAGFTDAEAWRLERRALVEARMAREAEERAQRAGQEEAERAQRAEREKAQAEKDAARAEHMARIASANDAACGQNLKCIADKAWAEASVVCQNAVERDATYQFEWTDGLMERKFSHYRWSNANQRHVTFYGDKVKFQNGFGAWQNMIYYCDYDTKTKSVVGLRMTGGRL